LFAVWEDLMSRSVCDLSTPALLLNVEKFRANVTRLTNRLGKMGVTLRPHMKTAKSVDVARSIFNTSTGPITVSTLKEAECFAASGFTDILYAVGISPDKLERVVSIRRRHSCDLRIIVDSVEAARAVASFSREYNHAIPTLIEIDVDGHRSGISPSDTQMIADIGRCLHNNGSNLSGVLAHAGESYFSADRAALETAAELERQGAIKAASALRSSGLPCPVISIGSTPTALGGTNFKGITEVRAGVFMFMDLFMSGVGVCEISDIALSVVATVIGHQKSKGWIIVDAGWMAFSRDRGTSKQRIDQGYGLVCDLDGEPYPNLIVKDASQEHGIITIRDSSADELPDLPIGAKIRILPNHACATAAAYSEYNLVRSEMQKMVFGKWGRFNGWE
jgi:D-serine deaminase-like pyridoxal phosphate-dependent protein